MKPDFDTILDECIRRIETGDDPNACLADYPEQATELEPLLTIARDMYTLSMPQGAAAAVLAGQQRIVDKFDEVYAPDVLSTTPTLWERWTVRWAQISQTFTSIFPKENIMYRKSFFAIAMVLVVLFAGTTMTAYAAQGSLPGDTLYSVKTTLEDFQVRAAWDTADEAEKSIQYGGRRIQEITELIDHSRHGDILIGVERFEYHLREALGALNIIAQNDPEFAQELALILTALLDEQSRLIAGLLENNPDANPMALNEALTATLSSMDTIGSVAGLDDDNGNENDDDLGNDNDYDDANDNDDNANENDDDLGNGNDDDDANENDEDDANENDDDDANDNDDDDANDNDDDDANDNDDDDANDNDDDDADDNDDDDADDNDDDDADDDNADDNDDDDADDNDDDANDNDDNDDDDGNENDDDAYENDDDDANDNDDEDGNDISDDDGNENDDDDANENDDDDANDNSDDDDSNDNSDDD